MSEWITVAQADQIPAGGCQLVATKDVEIAVFNLDGTFYAIENVCTHDGGELAGGTIEGDEVVCPRHAAHFSIKTGEALTPPAYEPVATFPVRVVEGLIQVSVD